MSTEVRWRRGTAAQNDAFTGADGEITVDTTNKSLRVHDGVTPGGHVQSTDITTAPVFTSGARGVVPAAGAGAHRFLSADGSFKQPLKMFRALSGLDPEKMSTNMLRIYPGSLANSDGTDYFETAAAIDINLATTGVNALDTGVVTNNTDYFVYMIANNTTRVLAAVVSQALFYGDVIVPAGYSLVRKLPWGFVYRTAWDGIPDFHLAYWPKPLTTYTVAESGSPYVSLSNGTATTFTDVNMSNWCPDNARLIRVQCKVDSVGSAGSAYVRSLGAATVGLLVGASNPTAGIDSVMTLDIRVTSTLQLQYKVTGGARLTITNLGYSHTEPV